MNHNETTGCLSRLGYYGGMSEVLKGPAGVVLDWNGYPVSLDSFSSEAIQGLTVGFIEIGWPERKALLKFMFF
jgi:hypothetical protein